MAKTTQMAAGAYEIVRPNTRFRQTTSKVGQPHEWTEYVTGDVVDLSAEEAERLKDIIGKPGAAAKVEADRLQAQADAAKAAAEDAKKRAESAARAAKSGKAESSSDAAEADTADASAKPAS